MIGARAFGETPGVSLANRRAHETGLSLPRSPIDLASEPGPQPAAVKRERLYAFAICALCVLAVIYNALLAVVNANVQALNSGVVIASEVACLAAALGLVLTSESRKKDITAFALLAFFTINAVAVSLVSHSVIVDMIRNTAILALFFMLGLRANWHTVQAVFRIVSIAVAAVLALEIFALETFASIFSPAQYFSNTRGIGTTTGDEPALFGNAVAWAERLSSIRLIDHRASSLFLEQVSLGNFAVVLAVFLTCTWERHTRVEKLLYIALIALLVITTASRAALALTLVAPLIRWFGPKVAGWANLLIMPSILGAAVAIVGSFPPSSEDNLIGRLGYTIGNLGDMSLGAITGAEAAVAKSFADSGYVFLIYVSSILGLLAFWLFVAALLHGRSVIAKRCALYTTLYVFTCLMISGTSLFSMKTAVLLWLFAGFSHRSPKESKGTASQLTGAPSTDMRAYPEKASKQ